MEAVATYNEMKFPEGGRSVLILKKVGAIFKYGDVVAGPMYIVGEDTDGGFCGLTEGQVQKYKEMFAETEDISPEEVEASIRFSFSPW